MLKDQFHRYRRDAGRHEASCIADHMGLWCVEPMRFQAACAAFKAGYVPVVAARKAEKDSEDPLPFQLLGGGIARVPITGYMSKRSKFGASTIDARYGLRAAVEHKDVKAILLDIDSPGGTTAGTQELADEVRAANDRKPVVAHIEDLGASAAYWVASQARRITANRTAEIGSIGTFATVYDYSGALKKEGIKAHVISTGPLKGAFTPGSKITPEQLAALQTEVDDLNAEFLKAVTAGRGGRDGFKDAASVATGGVWIADKAKALGLIDAVQSADMTLEELAVEAVANKPSAAVARAKLRLRNL